MHQGNDRISSLLAKIEAVGRDNDARQEDRADKMLNLERDTAELISLLVRSTNRTRILEVGTSNGFSTIWLAAALADIAAARPVVSIERDANKHQEAAENIRRAGLASRVTLRLGDATDVVRNLPGPFDCVFFDADRLSAPEQLTILLPKLVPDCLLLADNALSHPVELAGYRAAVEALPGFVSIVVSTGKGLHVAHRRGLSGEG